MACWEILNDFVLIWENHLWLGDFPLPHIPTEIPGFDQRSVWREITSGQRCRRCPTMSFLMGSKPLMIKIYKNDDLPNLPPKNWPFSQAIQGQPGLKKPAALHQQPAAPPPTEERPAHGLVSGFHCGESGVETRLTQSLVMSWERKSPENLGMPFLIIESG